MNLNQLTISEAKKGLKEKKFSASELLSDCLSAIENLDPLVKAFVTVNEKAVEEAKKLDEIGFSEEKPLWGIPLAIKDNFLTTNLRTTASSRVLEDFNPVYDASVIKKLKDACAIIIGKTNMDAWAHGSSTETSQFFTTKNPWDLGRLPGGSSGGSAAAVSADMCIAAIGSETAGSIRQPASWCGIVGFKPGYGVVSRYGVVAMGSSFDCPGPMTKNVVDSRLIFNILKGRDKDDATTVEYVPCSGKKIEEISVGLPKEYFSEEINQEIREIISEAVKKMEELGVKFSETSLIDPHFAIADYTILQRSEVSSNLARYDGTRYGNTRESFGDEAKRRIMLGTYSLSAGYYDAYFLKAQKVRSLICQDFEKKFREFDLIIAPTAPTTALPVGATKNQSMFGEVQDILVEASSLAGLPGISVNCGFSKEGLPIGMQIIGPRFSENLILSFAEKFESISDFSKNKPKIR